MSRSAYEDEGMHELLACACAYWCRNSLPFSCGGKPFPVAHRFDQHPVSSSPSGTTILPREPSLPAKRRGGAAQPHPVLDRHEDELPMLRGQIVQGTLEADAARRQLRRLDPVLREIGPILCQRSQEA